MRIKPGSCVPVTCFRPSQGCAPRRPGRRVAETTLTFCGVAARPGLRIRRVKARPAADTDQVMSSPSFWLNTAFACALAGTLACAPGGGVNTGTAGSAAGGQAGSGTGGGGGSATAGSGPAGSGPAGTGPAGVAGSADTGGTTGAA